MDVAREVLRALAVLLLLGLSSRAERTARPNIIVVVCDDLGWGDVSFHGSEQISTPNMDVLAADGVVLDSYYVSPMCTPSRTALLSGRHPIHTGMQHNVIYSAMPYAFPLQFKLMSDHFKNLGYETHAVGKWHLGHMTRNHTPTMRGFDSFYGYYSGHHGYTDHSCFEEYMGDPKEKWTGWGLDLWNNLEADWSKSGKYTTELFTEKAIELLKNRDRNKPFFLYLSHLAVHVGNFYALFEAPEKYVEMNSHIKNPKRRQFAAMLSALDDAIGQLVEALSATDAIQNTIFALTTDNGAATAGIDDSAGSNWPLRGTKMTHWEGGVRGTAFLWSPMIPQPRVYRELMHVSDWLPTLYSAAGGNVHDLGDIDGIDMWRSLVTGAGVPRTEVLHNIDPIWNMSALRFGRYKYVNGTYGEGHFDGWYQPAEVSDPALRYNYESNGSEQTSNETQWFYQPAVAPTRPPSSPGTRNALDWTCAAARTIRSLGRSLAKHTPDELRTDCGQVKTKECKPLEKPCLFDIDEDPCEMNNIAEEHPVIVRTIERRLADYRRRMVPPLNKPPTRKSDPRYFNYTWAPYLDSSLHDSPSPQTPLAV